MRLLLPFAALFVLSAPAASAGETPWRELAPGVNARLISADAEVGDGSTMIALELDMPPNFKTYWRIPGETGIATEIDWTDSNGITEADVQWPYPTVETRDGYLDYVYYGPTVLPIRVMLAGETALINAAITMGICSDICVPASASFSLSVDPSNPDRGQRLRINQALSLVPQQWEAGAQPIGDIAWNAVANALTVSVTDPAVDPGSLIGSVEGGGQLFGTPQKSPEPGIIFLPLLGKDGVKGLAGQTIEVTFKTDGGAYEVLRQLSAGN